MSFHNFIFLFLDRERLISKEKTGGTMKDTDRNFPIHTIAYTAFTTHVEYIIRKDLFVYSSGILEKKYKSEEKEKKEEKDKKEEKEIMV
ncbi:hypothetical protein IQ264_25345 [Phormidium sp. LEGE 05292]|uniref:hypothetical protein n=1 Tax=[Phormidium] sp. LEGE 05292 TaxID=767427 RepID=UPI001881E7E8|nr:hypothetical protein [Phormidium sp. LEGE 05292]MBE9228740.1 hypothetical protein [Phormidium sp. LEGE 05292]